MAESVYLWCLLTSVVCAGLLTHSYLKWKTELLFWSAIGFGVLGLNSLLAAIDLWLPSIDLTILRGLANLIGLGCLLLGFRRKMEHA